MLAISHDKGHSTLSSCLHFLPIMEIYGACLPCNEKCLSFIEKSAENFTVSDKKQPNYVLEMFNE